MCFLNADRNRLLTGISFLFILLLIVPPTVQAEYSMEAMLANPTPAPAETPNGNATGCQDMNPPSLILGREADAFLTELSTPEQFRDSSPWLNLLDGHSCDSRELASYPRPKFDGTTEMVRDVEFSCTSFAEVGVNFWEEIESFPIEITYKAKYRCTKDKQSPLEETLLIDHRRNFRDAINEASIPKCAHEELEQSGTAIVTVVQKITWDAKLRYIEERYRDFTESFEMNERRELDYFQDTGHVSTVTDEYIERGKIQPSVEEDGHPYRMRDSKRTSTSLREVEFLNRVNGIARECSSVEIRGKKHNVPVLTAEGASIIANISASYLEELKPNVGRSHFDTHYDPFNDQSESRTVRGWGSSIEKSDETSVEASGIALQTLRSADGVLQNGGNPYQAVYRRFAQREVETVFMSVIPLADRVDITVQHPPMGSNILGIPQEVSLPRACRDPLRCESLGHITDGISHAIGHTSGQFKRHVAQIGGFTAEIPVPELVVPSLQAFGTSCHNSTLPLCGQSTPNDGAEGDDGADTMPPGVSSDSPQSDLDEAREAFQRSFNNTYTSITTARQARRNARLFRRAKRKVLDELASLGTAATQLQAVDLSFGESLRRGPSLAPAVRQWIKVAPKTADSKIQKKEKRAYAVVISALTALRTSAKF